MSEGWVPVQRSVRDHWLWRQRRKFSYFEAFLDLWLSATHTPIEIMVGPRVVKLPRGGLVTSQVELARKWRWNRKTVKNFLKRLTQAGIIRFETVIGVDNGCTVITLQNFEDPQDLLRRMDFPQRD